jgi:hypothetical protein
LGDMRHSRRSGANRWHPDCLACHLNTSSLTPKPKPAAHHLYRPSMCKSRRIDGRQTQKLSRNGLTGSCEPNSRPTGKSQIAMPEAQDCDRIWKGPRRTLGIMAAKPRKMRSYRVSPKLRPQLKDSALFAPKARQ